MSVHCVQPSCPSPLTQHCLAKRNNGSIWMLKLPHLCVRHSMNHACWRLRSARMSSIRLFVQDPMKNLQTYKVACVRIKEACKKVAIKILSLHARMQNTFWMAISCILVPGSKPENLKSRTKSRSLVWTVSVWTISSLHFALFPFTSSLFWLLLHFICPTNEILVSASVRTEPMYWRALVMPVLHGYWDCQSTKCFVLCILHCHVASHWIWFPVVISK